MQSDFTLLKIGWFTRLGVGTPEAEVHTFYRALLQFLQEHQLTVRLLLGPGEPLTDDSNLMRSDLTDKGFLLYQRAEQKWLKGVDRGKDPIDMRVFAKELTKIELAGIEGV